MGPAILILRSFLVLAFLCTPLSAGDRIVRGWTKDLVRCASLLTSHDYDAALKVSSRVTNDMLESLGPGDGSTKAFGLAIAYKAVALAGLSRGEEALWYWHTAIAIYPPYAESDLKDFGEPGAFIRSHYSSDRPSYTPRTDDVLVEPKELRRRDPRYPPNAWHIGMDGSLAFAVVINKEGRLTSPRVLSNVPMPSLCYAALEALKEWRYTPGTVNGEPIEFPLTVTARFNIDR